MTRAGRVYYPSAYSKFKAAAARAISGAAAFILSRPKACALAVCLTLRLSRPKTTKLSHPKPDVDNYAKSVLDAANGILWDDDSQIVDLRVTKEWAAPGEPGNIQITMRHA